MGVHEFAEPRSAGSRAGRLLAWLGGGHRHECDGGRVRSAHAVAGVVVLVGAVLAGSVAGLAVGEATRWPWPAAVASALVLAVLVGAVTRGVAGGQTRGRAGVAGRAAVAVAVGVAVGELAALVVFSASIDGHLDERAARNVDSAPAVEQASAALRRTQAARAGLDDAVEQARANRDKALVVARCEYHPSPACPQTRITGVPGPGPETRTAKELLADAQHELDGALAARDRQAPGLDAEIARREQALADARHSVTARAGRGLGARWAAMNALTSAGGGALPLRLVTIAFFVLVCLLPLVLRLWGGETTDDRRATARADRERAELEADTAIAIKRAQVRRDAEMMWAEHQLTQARLAIEAQTEIDRERQRRRVTEAVEAPVRPSAEWAGEPMEQDMYLPIAAEAEAASLAIAPLPAEAAEVAAPDAPERLPSRVETGGEVEPHHERGTPLIPSIPMAAARWIRPLVPPLVARVIDTTTQPLRTARQVFEEVEEITFAFKRTRKVTVDSEASPAEPARRVTPDGPAGERRDESGRPAEELVGSHPSLRRAVGTTAGGAAPGSTPRDDERELTGREGPRELEPPAGPRQLPPPG